MLDPPLLVGDEPEGARGNIGGGVGVRPASPRWAGPVGGTRRDLCARGSDQGLARRRGRAAIIAGCWDFQCPS
jgi:hypothetical protein